MNVPSSISSSDQKSRPCAWLKIVAAGFIIAIVLLCTWETFWRASGYTPSIEDDLGIWAIQRQVLEDEEPPSVVLLGSSRMQLDVDPKIIQAESGLRTLMLAIDGSSPLPVLADLAKKSSFNGLVLCSFLPQWLGDGDSGKSRSAKWARKFHQKKWSFWIETRLSMFMQSNFVFRYPGLLPGKLWEKYLEGKTPNPPYAPMRSDRYRPADYAKSDISQLRLARIKRQREIVAAAQPLNAQEFSTRISEINAMVHQIEKRGGRVIFLRLPSCAEILELEEQTWPRRQYWNRFAENTTARTIHFTDHYELSRFDCPDGSHLDNREAKSFTRSLVDILDLR